MWKILIFQWTSNFFFYEEGIFISKSDLLSETIFGLHALVSCWYLDTWAMLQKVDASIMLLWLNSQIFIAAGLFCIRVNPIYFMVNHFKMLKNGFFRFCLLLFCRAKNVTGLPDLSWLRRHEYASAMEAASSSMAGTVFWGI